MSGVSFSPNESWNDTMPFSVRMRNLFASEKPLSSPRTKNGKG